jgi:tRNA1Val (adenine37-N6)-methyltransferase
MANSYFRFKQFKILQEKSAMRVNTDGVLLGSWADVSGAQRILDVGTGTGVVALMVAQRNPSAMVDAVEIDPLSAEEAAGNAARSPWANRVRVVCASFQGFASSAEFRYDLIVSNPPYFSHSLKPPDDRRTLTRHTDTLPTPDLLEGITKLMLPEGRFCGIFPYAEGNVFIAQASRNGLFCSKKLNIQPKPGDRTLRVLVQLEAEKKATVESSLCIHLADGTFSKDYRNLTSEFYIHF